MAVDDVVNLRRFREILRDQSRQLSVPALSHRTLLGEAKPKPLRLQPRSCACRRSAKSHDVVVHIRSRFISRPVRTGFSLVSP
jgi:hypothetical protein